MLIFILLVLKQIVVYGFPQIRLQFICNLVALLIMFIFGLAGFSDNHTIHSSFRKA